MLVTSKDETEAVEEETVEVENEEVATALVVVPSPTVTPAEAAASAAVVVCRVVPGPAMTLYVVAEIVSVVRADVEAATEAEL